MVRHLSRRVYIYNTTKLATKAGFVVYKSAYKRTKKSFLRAILLRFEKKPSCLSYKRYNWIYTDPVVSFVKYFVVWYYKKSMIIKNYSCNKLTTYRRSWKYKIQLAKLSRFKTITIQTEWLIERHKKGPTRRWQAWRILIKMKSDYKSRESF